MTHSSRPMDRLLAILAVGCAVVVTGLLVRRELMPRGADAAPATPRPVERWEQFAVSEHIFGPASAPVTLVEFSDFECPACGQFTRTTLKTLREKFPTELRIVFRHWPLANHRFAYPTARAAECAGRQGRFEAFHDLIFARQDSLGLKPFSDFARESGVPDLAAFAACHTETDSLSTISRDVAAVMELGGRGTPTVLLEGTLYPRTPSLTELEARIKEALAAHEATTRR